MDYGALIRDAWAMTWRYRFLWVLGLFAGSGFAGCAGPPSVNYQVGRGQVGAMAPDAQRAMAEAQRWVAANAGLIAALAVLAVVIVLGLIVLSLVAQGGMARATADLALGRPMGSGEAWRAGLRLFWRYLGLWLLLVVAAFAVALAVGVLMALTFGLASLVGGAIGVVLAVLGGLIAFALILVAIPVAVGVGITLTYALRAIAVEDVGPIAAVESGFGVLQGNLGTSLLVWLIGLGLGIGAGIALAIALVIVAIPLAILGAAIYAAAGFTAPTVVYLVVAGLAFAAAAWLLSAIVNTFFWSYWTNAYLRLTGRLAPVAPLA